MQQNRNDPESAMAGAMISGGFLIGILLIFVAALLSAALTLISLCVLVTEREIRLFRKSITPAFAGGFILNGNIGGIVVGLFGLWLNSIDLLLDQNRFAFFVAGYVIGSLSYAVYYSYNSVDIEAEAYERERKAMGIPLIATPSAAKPSSVEATEPARQFEFATWNDAEPRA